MPSAPESKLGFALNTKGKLPINGLRHPVLDDTNGWYIWYGEHFSNEAKFFAPLHTNHLYQEHPDLARFLGLPPGFRFSFAPEYLEIWFDESLLKV